MSLFARRVKRSLPERIKDALWPQQGIGRTLHYYRHRLLRLPGTSHSIAAGIAAGAAMCFMPLGLHIPLAVGLALLLRGNVIAAALTTVFVGNPLVSGLLMGADLGLGEWLLGHQRAKAFGTDISIFEAFLHPLKVLEAYGLPFMLGAIILSSIACFGVYLIARKMVVAAHAARARRLRRRWEANRG